MHGECFNKLLEQRRRRERRRTNMEGKKEEIEKKQIKMPFVLMEQRAKLSI